MYPSRHPCLHAAQPQADATPYDPTSTRARHYHRPRIRPDDEGREKESQTQPVYRRVWDCSSA
eukprot:2469433-Rhodomonas_salina.1